MNSSGHWKTTTYNIFVYWPTLGDARDFAFWNVAGTWIAKNEKALNRMAGAKVCAHILEQFPTLQEIECRDFSGRGAKLVPDMAQVPA